MSSRTATIAIIFVRTEAHKWPERLASFSTLIHTPDHVTVGNYLIAEFAEHLD
jgi:hypothetical protein